MLSFHLPRWLRPLAAACGLAGYLATTWLGLTGYVLCAQIGGPAVIEQAACCACDRPAPQTAAGDGAILPAAGGCGPCSDTSLAAADFVCSTCGAGGVGPPQALAALLPAHRLDLSPPPRFARDRAWDPPPRAAALALRAAILLI